VIAAITAMEADSIVILVLPIIFWPGEELTEGECEQRLLCLYPSMSKVVTPDGEPDFGECICVSEESR
jgi:hypothetical protein